MAWYPRCRRTTRTKGHSETVLIDNDDQRQRANVSVASQRIFFHGRSRHGRAHRDHEIRDVHELGGRAQQQKGPGARAGKRSDYPRRARVSGRGGHDELAARRVLARYRSGLHAGSQFIQHVVSHRSRSARIDGARRKAARRGRLGREVPDRHRACNGQSRLAPEVPEQRRRRHRVPHDRRWIALRRRPAAAT